MSKLVCIVGMTGSGKTEVTDFFKKRNFQYLRFGQITLDEVKKRNLEPTEENERPIREEYRRQYGPAAYAILNCPKFDEMLAQGDVVGDGLYSWSEYKYLQEKYGKQFIVVAIYSSPQTRYARLVHRAERYQNDPNLIYRSATVEQAKSRDFAEIEKIEKGGPIAMADYTLINEGTIEDLNKQLENIFQKINGTN